MVFKKRARYAIYYVPPADSFLYKGVSRILGRCIYKGGILAQPEGFISNNYTRIASRYGAHATIVAPFYPKCSEIELINALENFCETRKKFLLPEFYLSVLKSGFFALTVKHDENIAQLEEQCVRQFHQYAEPLEDTDIIRRGKLSPTEMEYLICWGYHRIFDLFLFHITLTDPVPKDIMPKIRTELDTYLNCLFKEKHLLGSLSLCRQGGMAEPFKVVSSSNFNL